jgi:predicted TIM-barrel fold metal-dependent hydrolase
MIVDSHVHVLPESLRGRRDAIGSSDPWFAACHAGGRVIATVEELIAAMDESEVDRSVCFGWPFADSAMCTEVNDHLAEAQRRFPDRVVAFATINPVAPDAGGELRRCADLGLRGVGELNCDAQGFSLDDPLIGPAISTSVELGLPWTLHCSEPVGHEYAGKGTATPDKIAAFAQRYPELQLVCAHLGGGLPFYAHMPEVAQLCRRLWFDTSAVPFLYEPTAYRAIADVVGADRLLFGSDYPLLRAEPYRKAFVAAGLNDSEQRAVLGDNAAALLRL